MTADQAIVLLLLAAILGLFLWGRWRHDLVAVAALLACVAAGLVPTDAAFAGFGHPAVVTVACVLILSRAVQLSGAVDALAPRLLPAGAGPTASVAILTALVATLSAFINNVGALALLLPFGLQVASRHDLPPGRVLMPLAFGSILGGMTTLIGTPPNLIVAGFRAATAGSGFAMFDFAPVGAAVATAGVAFIAAAAGWLVPARSRSAGADFDVGAYLTEVRVRDGTKLVGQTLAEVEPHLDELGAQVLGLIRHEVRMPAARPAERLRAGDILVVEAEPEALAATLSRLGLRLEEDVPHGGDDGDDEPSADASGPTDAGGAAAAGDAAPPTATAEPARATDEIVLGEVVVLPDSSLAGRSASDIELRTRFAINLLAVSRQGHRSTARLRSLPLRPGDVLLLQGAAEAIAGFASGFGCVPLAPRPLRLPDPRRAATTIAILVAAVAAAAFGLVPAAIGFAGGALAVTVLRLLPLREIYTAIDWPVVVLLGALMPVAEAVASTGAADLLARLLLDGIARGNPVVALTVVLVATMTLSDFMNNAATAAVMCPIALRAAAQLGVAADPFLMAVAIGASCAFLTPIGHQNSTLILGPGGFRFGDYWRLGLPLEVIVVATAVPLLLVVWPL